MPTHFLLLQALLSVCLYVLVGGLLTYVFFGDFCRRRDQCADDYIRSFTSGQEQRILLVDYFWVVRLYFYTMVVLYWPLTLRRWL
jgi:hypothetical protein